MIWPDASWNITAMAYVKISRRSKGEFITHPMGAKNSLPNSEKPVAPCVLASLPEPARFSLLDKFPEADVFEAGLDLVGHQYRGVYWWGRLVDRDPDTSEPVAMTLAPGAEAAPGDELDGGDGVVVGEDGAPTVGAAEENDHVSGEDS